VANMGSDPGFQVAFGGQSGARASTTQWKAGSATVRFRSWYT
jgi:hypothetical protein